VEHALFDDDLGREVVLRRVFVEQIDIQRQFDWGESE
jgi:hypothetical protein